MNDPDTFDAFYKDARDRLLLQTYALTGDLPAARSAVRDTFIVAWHHWRKVSRHPEPEDWARPYAWAHAQRRHTARVWHRERGLDPEVRATLDALGKLPMTQRKALLLTHLSSVSMSDLAREVGLPLPEAERQLQTAAAQFAVHREVATTDIRTLFEPLRDHVAAARWPRPTILRRAGATRRRTHTVAGVAVAVVALVLSGSVVTDRTGVRPTLARDAAPAAQGDLPGPGEQATAEPPVTFDETVLLAADAVGAALSSKPGRWRVEDTSDNAEGDGLVMPCQADRYADPRGRAALVRTFLPGGAAVRAGAGAAQTVELSTTEKRARGAYDAALSWFAGCGESRVQLLASREVAGVGDEARLLELRSWRSPGATYLAGVARTGMVTTVVTTRTPPTPAPPAQKAAGLLADAVRGLCDQPDAGACVATPRLRTVRPIPAGPVPGMLVEVDLPPVNGVALPWVGTEPQQARDNVADTACDLTDFGPPVTNALTRSFLIPEAKRLPVEFGLTQTIGTLPVPQGKKFVERVRTRMGTCPDRQLGTDVTRIASFTGPQRDLAVWRVTVEVSERRSVTFLMGVVREGTSVSQVGFVPHRAVSMGPDRFVALVRRAAERLPDLPPPD